jgi:hypothetical protein
MSRFALLTVFVLLSVFTFILPAQSIPSERKVEPIAAPIQTQVKLTENPSNQEPIERLVEMQNAPFLGPDVPPSDQVEYAVIPARKSLASIASSTLGIRATPLDAESYARTHELELESERVLFLLAGKKGWALVAVPNPGYSFYVFRREKRAVVAPPAPATLQSGQAKKSP